jgi:hypothetical protein
MSLIRRCQYCNNVDWHDDYCTVLSIPNSEQFFKGFKQGAQKSPIINSTHPAYFRGWCRALREIQRSHKRAC